MNHNGDDGDDDDKISSINDFTFLQCKEYNHGFRVHCTLPLKSRYAAKFTLQQ